MQSSDIIPVSTFPLAYIISPCNSEGRAVFPGLIIIIDFPIPFHVTFSFFQSIKLLHHIGFCHLIPIIFFIYDLLHIFFHTLFLSFSLKSRLSSFFSSIFLLQRLSTFFVNFINFKVRCFYPILLIRFYPIPFASIAITYLLNFLFSISNLVFFQLINAHFLYATFFRLITSVAPSFHSKYSQYFCALPLSTYLITSLKKTNYTQHIHFSIKFINSLSLSQTIALLLFSFNSQTDV